MILGSKNQGHFSVSRPSHDSRSDLTWCSTVAAIEPGSAGCSNDKGTVGNRLPYGAVAFRVLEYISAVDGHRSCPKTPGSCFADYRQLCLSHILHRPRNGADVPRAAGPY